MVLAFAGQIGSPAAAQTRAHAETFQLDNGLTAIVLPDHRAPVVTHQLWFRVGSADESRGKSGLAHFLEHLMFKATESRAAGEYARTVARNGGQNNARTSFDYTNYFFRVARDRLPLVMQLEADRLVNLRLADSEVLPERNVVQEERRQSIESNPAAVLDEQVWAKLFAGHPYGVPVIGRMDEVAALSREDAIGWYRKWYSPDNAVLIVAGDITAAELKPLTERIYGGLPRGAAPKVRALPPATLLTESETIVHRDPKVRQPAWTRNWLGARAGHTDVEALQVALQILGGRRTGRMYRQLVEGGQAVSADAYSVELAAAGVISLSVAPTEGVSVANVRRTATALLEEFAVSGPEGDELERAKAAFAASVIYRRDSQMSLADWYGGLVASGLSVDQIETWEDRIAAVTREDVMRVTRAYLVEPNYVDAILLPEGR